MHPCAVAVKRSAHPSSILLASQSYIVAYITAAHISRLSWSVAKSYLQLVSLPVLALSVWIQKFRNFGILIKHCNTEIRKHMFPLFSKPNKPMVV